MKLYFKEKEKKKLLGSNDCVHDFRLFFLPLTEMRKVAGVDVKQSHSCSTASLTKTPTVLSENTQLIIAGNVQQQLGEWSAVA